MTTRLYTLLALAVFGCDGRYLLGSASDAAVDTPNAGQAGASDVVSSSGAAGGSGNDGGAAGVSEPASLGGAGASTDGGALDDAGAGVGGESNMDPRPSDRIRWLAVQTFPSSASSQTLIQLVDLQKADWAGVTVESVSATNVLPSSDQRWLLYASFRKSAALGDVYDYYVINIAGKTPGARQLVLADQPSWANCIWAPDGKHIACLNFRADLNSDDPRLALFDTRGASVGSEVDVAPVLGTPTFFGGSTLVYGNLQKELLRLDLGADAPGTPTPLGVTTDSLLGSLDGERALAHSDDLDSDVLLDVRSAEIQPLDLPSSLVVTSRFEAGLTSSEDPDDSGNRDYTFYAVNGLQPSAVGQLRVKIPSPSLFPLQLARRSVVILDGEQLDFTYIPERGSATSQTVSGDYATVQDYLLDPTGHFLYFSSGEVDGAKPLSSTYKSWVSRLGPAGAEPPQLLTEGFVVASALFSPDGTRLLLAADTSHDDDPQPAAIHLITLSEADAPRDRLLPMPLNWTTPTFSRDSSYLAVIGYSLSEGARELYALDLLAPDAAPKLLLSCTSNPSTLPGCPNIVTF